MAASYKSQNNSGNFATAKASQATAVNTTTRMVPVGALHKYLWNLPPHDWSRSIEPASLMDPTMISERFDKGYDKSQDVHRRGRIYWVSRVNSEYMSSGSATNNGSDPRWGMQFIWNPNEFSTSVGVNLDITPTATDKFVQVVGAFPSGEYLTVSLRLDRTNDFFCLESLNVGNNSDIALFREMATYYNDSLNDWKARPDERWQREGNNTIIPKLKNLAKYGTLADLEYLYKAINGPGWVNKATGMQSSDVGFLAPTLLMIELGPVAYLGYVQNITVNHTSFTKSMIPMRTDVNLQFNLMATAGLSTRGKAVSQ